MEISAYWHMTNQSTPLRSILQLLPEILISPNPTGPSDIIPKVIWHLPFGILICHFSAFHFMTEITPCFQDSKDYDSTFETFLRGKVKPNQAVEATAEANLCIKATTSHPFILNGCHLVPGGQIMSTCLPTLGMHAKLCPAWHFTLAQRCQTSKCKAENRLWFESVGRLWQIVRERPMKIWLLVNVKNSRLQQALQGVIQILRMLHQNYAQELTASRNLQRCVLKLAWELYVIARQLVTLNSDFTWQTCCNLDSKGKMDLINMIDLLRKKSSLETCLSFQSPPIPLGRGLSLLPAMSWQGS